MGKGGNLYFVVLCRESFHHEAFFLSESECYMRLFEFTIKREVMPRPHIEQHKVLFKHNTI